jgi:hypothetical protein
VKIIRSAFWLIGEFWQKNPPYADAGCIEVIPMKVASTGAIKAEIPNLLDISDATFEQLPRFVRDNDVSGRRGTPIL